MTTSRVAFYLACASVISILVGIAYSQILLALAIAALLISGDRLRFPPIKLPLAIFVVWTILAVVLSPDPRGGSPQLRKMILFLILLLVASTFRTLAEVRAVGFLWAATGTVSAVVSFFLFWRKYEEAKALHRGFYNYYVSSRITGFASHWITFGGEEMMVLLMLLAFLLFSQKRKWKPLGWACVAVLGVSLVLGWDRSIFLLGLPLGVCYLVWFWNRRLLLLAPVPLALALLVAPMRERIFSAFEPHGQTDSNMHRVILRRTGIRIIEAHPLFGLGPEQLKPPPGERTSAAFERYIPKDVTRPLPAGWYGHLHNIYLQYPAERGIPALLALLWMIGVMA